MFRISADDLQSEFESILKKTGFTDDKARKLAHIFTDNTVDGVYSHGINRFPRFIENTRDGYIQPDAEPEPIKSFGALEQWDGQLGPGPLNARQAADRAMALAAENGIGMVTLRNTNHWLRGGTYGWQAAKAGFALMCWTNTTPNMPPWGAVDARVGNNPFIIAVPRKKGPVVLDIALSQFSYGKLEVASITGEHMPVAGGYDTLGKITTNPREILKTGRPLPIGFWKGSGLAMVLDLLGALLSTGKTTADIGENEVEYGLAQIFIAFDVNTTSGRQVDAVADRVVDYVHGAKPTGHKPVFFPGERAMLTREKNLLNGIELEESVWKRILELKVSSK